MTPQPPPGQGPIDPRGAFSPPPPPGGAGGPPPGYYPPIPPMPPMMPFYPPPPPRGRSFAGAIFTTLATTVLSLSLFLNVFLLFSSASSSRDGLKLETLVDGDASEVVAVLPIHGVIDERMVDRFSKMLARAEKDSNVKAIVLDIDSPGGGVTSADQMYARVLAAKQKKHVVATIGALGASGGYYIACAAEYIYAEKTSLTGSIGVIMPSFNISELTEKYGIKETTLTSDGAIYKNAGSMFKPENEEDRKYFKSILNHAFGRFKEIVALARGPVMKTKSATIESIATGKIFTAKEAFDLGLVDAIDYAPAAWAKAASLAGLSKQQVVKYEPDLGLFGAMFESKFPGTPPQAGVTINGVNVNVDRNLLTELLTPRPMYLWRGQ